VKPFDIIAGLYTKFPQPRSFDEDIAAHISTGYVFSAPDFFIMGRAIDRFADPSLIEDPWHQFDKTNAWLVYAFSGSSQNIIDFIPNPLQWIGFQRRGNPLRFYDFSALTRRLSGAKGTTTAVRRGFHAKASEAGKDFVSRSPADFDSFPASRASSASAPSNDLQS